MYVCVDCRKGWFWTVRDIAFDGSDCERRRLLSSTKDRSYAKGGILALDDYHVHDILPAPVHSRRLVFAKEILIYES